jgi:hypothetical protein
MTKVKWAALAAAVGLSTSAHGSVITLDDTARGWYTDSSTNNVFTFDSSAQNYFAGFCSADGCGAAGEHRNFFTFNIPKLDGQVSSAVLTVSTGSTSFAQSPTARYQLTSIPTNFGFSDIGTGTAYGALTYSDSDTDWERSIELNAPALAAISSNTTFSLGGRITTLSPEGQADEYLFGATGSPYEVAQLTIVTAASVVPEPSVSLLSGIGLAGICLILRSNTTRAQSTDSE